MLQRMRREREILDGSTASSSSSSDKKNILLQKKLDRKEVLQERISCFKTFFRIEKQRKRKKTNEPVVTFGQKL